MTVEGNRSSQLLLPIVGIQATLIAIFLTKLDLVLVSFSLAGIGSLFILYWIVKTTADSRSLSQWLSILLIGSCVVGFLFFLFTMLTSSW